MFSFRRHTDKRNGLNIDTREITLEPADNARLLSLCGPFDDNIKQLERRLGIEINRRDNHFKLTGRPICVTAAADILRSLYVDTAPMRGQIQDIEPEQIHLAIKEARVLEQSAESVPEYGKAVNIKTKRGVIKPRTPNQAQYIANILDHDITFGVGPAGTGKTYLAVAAAVDALERQEIRRILLTRPAVEAGEKLGFLPGDLSQKVDPYLRPLYDGLFDMLGADNFTKYQERGSIEVAPLAYMRGRTLDDSFIILDEAQNTTPEQMKMFLTRLGFGSKAVITGDITQIDLPDGKQSGLREALRVLQTMGYVTIVHGKGAFIKACQPSSEEAERWFEGNIFALRDIYMVREALEPLVAREAARHITEEALAELRQIVDQTAHAAALPPEDANANLMAQLDEKFHEKICESTNNPFLVSLYKQFIPALHTYRLNSFAILKNCSNVVEPHRRIMEALAQHDAEAADLEMRQHMRISKNDTREAARNAGMDAQF